MDVFDVSQWTAAAALAAAQHGRITTEQLRRCGISRSGVEKAVAAGRLFREHRGVYALGHPGRNTQSRWMSAVLAGGRAAVLSERSGATLWRMREAEHRDVDVTVPRPGTRRRDGIRFHTSPLPAREVTVHQGIPVTTPARTAVDMAHVLDDPDDVHRMLREMQFRRLFVLAEIEAANARRPSRLIGQVIDDLRPTDSPIEDAFKSNVLRRHRLPEPRYQARVEGFRVDFFWPAARLIVEVDGAAHAQPAMRQADSMRDNVLHMAGYLVLRYTAADIRRRPDRVAAQIREALRVRHLMDV